MSVTPTRPASVPTFISPRMSPPPTVQFTFLGEKLSAELPSSYHFARDLPEELHDQSDVVCPQPPHTSQKGTGTVQHDSMHTRQHTHAVGCTALTHTAAPRYCGDTIGEDCSHC
ncbi:hypothetical protein AMECASPLE_001722 [Ameca splendens]|uniref:Uncharacterized protein n=1 Tax=Ameca splendens TaxID=208324 RepID=A0ABV0XAW8_9TELE